MEEYIIQPKTFKIAANKNYVNVMIDPFTNIEERISKLDKDVDKTIRAIKVNIINKKQKFRVRRYKSYYGRF